MYLKESKLKKLFTILIFAITLVFSLNCYAAQENNKDDHINIYITNGSLPTLYALLNMYIDEAESYTWYSRGQTVNPDLLPEHVKIIDGTVINSETADFFPREYIDVFINFVKKIHTNNPDKKINLFVDDLRVQQDFTLMTYNGIPRDKYNVYLMSDGTGSYSLFKTLFSKPESAYSNWTYYKNNYINATKKASNGDISFAWPEGYMPIVSMRYQYSAFYASTLENVEYWLQWPELLKCEDEQTNKELEKANIVKKLPNEMYASLPEEKKAAFLKSIGLNKNEWDTKYFPDMDNGKKYMIISGTSPAVEGGNFDIVVKNIIEEYGPDYTYYYKPHPSWSADKVQGRKEFLNQNNIIELPAALPMECILWAYPNVNIGGYSSSLYMSATGGQVKFFISNVYTALNSPLPDIYNLGFYNGCKFFRITSKDLSSDDEITLSSTSSYFNNDNTKNITLNFSKVDTNADVYLTVYNDNGTIKKLEKQQINPDNTSVTFKNVSNSDLISTTKILVWNKNMKPYIIPVYGNEF